MAAHSQCGNVIFDSIKLFIVAAYAGKIKWSVRTLAQINYD